MLYCFVDAEAASGAVQLQKPLPPVAGEITHHSVELHWQASFDAAYAVIGSQSGDDRIQVIVQLLSPVLDEAWQQVYRCHCYYYVNS